MSIKYDCVKCCYKFKGQEKNRAGGMVKHFKTLKHNDKSPTRRSPPVYDCIICSYKYKGTDANKDRYLEKHFNSSKHLRKIEKEKVEEEKEEEDRPYNLTNLVHNNGSRDLTNFIVHNLNIKEYYYLEIIEVKTYIELHKNKNENTVKMNFSNMSCPGCYSDDSKFETTYESRSSFKSVIDSLIRKSTDFEYEFAYDYENEDEDGEYDPEEDSSYYACGTISIPMMYFLEHFCNTPRPRRFANDFESFIIDFILDN